MFHVYVQKRRRLSWKLARECFMSLLKFGVETPDCRLLVVTAFEYALYVQCFLYNRNCWNNGVIMSVNQEFDQNILLLFP